MALCRLSGRMENEMKKISGIIVLLCMMAFASSSGLAQSDEMRVEGNRLVTDKGEITLRGVNVPSLGWGMAEHIYESVIEMFDSWNANVIRVAVQPKYWNNGSIAEKGENSGLSAEKYREYVDNLISLAASRGKYVILDCHTYVMPIQETYDFWTEMAQRYGSNPTVIFGLLNEPHDIKPQKYNEETSAWETDSETSTWEVWRNGGNILKDGSVVRAYGHQELVEAIRDAGAKNILAAGGQNWAYDISGIAGGYALDDCGTNGDTSKSGNGIIYDTHIYPSKGNRDSWNYYVGQVRKFAPVIAGEWGWDGSDSTVTGNSASISSIWMRQLIKWMDDGYGEYDGVPLNYTAWNLHMKSTPRMITGWDFKPTVFNGAYIKNHLLSQKATANVKDGEYINDFTEDVFRGYSNNRTSTDVSDGKLIMTYKADYSALMYLPLEWDLNGTERLSMDISGRAGDKVNIGFYCTDTEYWMKEIELDGTLQHISIGADELKIEGNPNTDGLLKGIYAIAVKGSTVQDGTLTIDNVKIETSANPTVTAPKYEYADNGRETVFDIDNTNFASMKDYKGPASSSYFNSEIAETDGADKKTTKAIKISYNRKDGLYGGNTTLNFGDIRVPRDTKYFSICVKSSGTSQRLDISVGGTGVQIITAAGDDEWRQYVFDLSDEMLNPDEMTSVVINAGYKLEDFFWIDNISLTRDYPEKTAAYQYREAKYGFEREWSWKRYPVMSTQNGTDGDKIWANIISDGYLSPKGYAVTYNRTEGEMSRAVVDYKSSSDFFKSRPSIKDDMSYGTELVFYAKTLTGEQNISVSLIDPVYETYTNEITVHLSGEGFNEYRIPLDKFLISDCDTPIKPGRMRGIRVGGADKNTSGSFVIDDINITNKEEISKNTYYNTVYVNDFDNDVFAGVELAATGTQSDSKYFKAEKISSGGYKNSAALKFDNLWGAAAQTVTLTGGIPSDWDMSKALCVGAMTKAESISYGAKRYPQTGKIKLELYNGNMLTGTAYLDASLNSWGWSMGEFALNTKTDNGEDVIAGSDKLVISMADSQISSIIIDDLTFSYMPIDRSEEIKDSVNYYETFEGSSMNFANGGLNNANDDYFRVVDTKGIINDKGQNIQYIFKQKYTSETAPYLYSQLPSSWGLQRASEVNFIAGLMTDSSVKWYWRTKNSAAYSDEYCNETLTPIIALADIYGREYRAEVTLNSNVNTTEYSIPLSSFKDKNGNSPDLTLISEVRIYPDCSTDAAAFWIDNFGFKTNELKVENFVIGDKLTFDITGTPSENDMLYVCAYNADKTLASVKLEKASEGKKEFDKTDGAADYKIFIWNNMRPVIK